MATMPVTVLSEINGLYVSLYGVPATEAGITYWLNVLAAHDPSVTLTSTISESDSQYLGIQMTAGSPIVNGTTYFATLYPASMTDTQFVEALYQNMSGFQGTVAGDQYWAAQLQTLENGGDSVIQAREAIAGEFVHDFLTNNLSLGAAYWGLDQSDYNALVAGQEALLNKVAVSEDWAAANSGLLNYTTVTSSAFAAGQDLMNEITSTSNSEVAAENAITAAINSNSLTPITTLITPPTVYTLTTGVDTITASGSSLNGVTASLATGNDEIQAILGTGATLNAFDDLAPGGTGNSMIVVDNEGGQTLPLGATMSNIQTLTLQEQGNAGTGTSSFNVTAVSGLAQFTATSVGNATDYFTAGATTNVTAIADAGAVNLSGGLADTITAVTGITVSGAAGAVTATDSTSGDIDVTGGTTIIVTQHGTGKINTVDGTSVTATASGNGNISITDPTGTATVQDTGTGSIDVVGGTTITVTDGGTGGITVGSGLSAANNPSGAVTVTDTGDGAITENGGTVVSISSAGGAVDVGQTVTSGVVNLPSGNIAVTETAATGNSIAVDGGVAVTISAQGQGVEVGKNVGGPSGAITITQATVLTGVTGLADGAGSISVGGGTSVTINTTGGGVQVEASETGAVATGAVNITDTFSGANAANAEDLTVYAGTIVNLTTTPASGSISVGQATFADAANDPTGNVTISNSETYGGTTTYGTGATNVYMNGGTSASITGGTVGVIEDIQTQASPAGTSNLASVSLTGVTGNAGAVSIVSGALNSLTIDNSTATTPTGTVTVTEVAGHALTVTLSGDSSAPTIVDNAATSVGVSASGSTNQTVNLQASKTTSLAMRNTGAGTLTLGSVTAADLTSITVSGSGTVALGDLDSLLGLTSVNASAATGAVSAEIDGNNANFTGNGNDTVTVDDGLQAGGQVGGGGGSSTVVLTTAEANYNPVLNPTGALSSVLTGFTNLGLGAGAGGAGAAANYNASGFTGLIVNGATLAVDFTNVTAGATLTVDQADAGGITYTLASPGAGSSLTATVNGGFTQTITVSGIPTVTLDSTGGVNTITLNNDATLTTLNLTGNSAATYAFSGTTGGSLTTIDDSSSAAVTLGSSVNGADLTTINVTGSGSLTMNAGSGGVALATINAAAGSGAINVLSATLDASGVTIDGGAGALTAGNRSSTQASVDNYTTGSGGGAILIGLGGAGGVTNGGTGTENVNLSASATNPTGPRDVLVMDQAPGGSQDADGRRSIVTGFAVTDSDHSSDQLSFHSDGSVIPEVVLANQTGITGAISGATYSMINGVLTITAGSATAAQELGDAEAIVNAEADSIVAFQSSSATFVVVSPSTGTLSAMTDEIYQLNGVTGVTGFGDHAGGSSIYVDQVNVTANDVTVAVLNTATTVGSASDAVGNLTATGVTTHASDTTNFTLANYGQVVISGDNGAASGQTLGTITVTLGGPAGTAALDVNFDDGGSHGSTLDELSVSSDHNLTIDANAANGATITSLIDATNTLNKIVIDGSDSIGVGGVASTSLVTVDDSSASGAINLTDALNNQTLMLGSGTVTLQADGSADVITESVSTAAVTGHTNGAGDSLTFDTTGGIGVSGTPFVAAGNSDDITFSGASGINYLTANGNGDVISLGNSSNTLTAAGAGDQITAGSGANTITAIGATDVINLGTGGNTVHASGGGDHISFTGSATAASTVDGGTGVGIGADDTVTFGTTTGADSQTIALTGTVTDGTSASYNFTTLTNVVDNTGDLLVLNNATTETMVNGTGNASEVNVATATSLANALDIAAAAVGTLAAHTGQIDWFQYQGNTYLVEADNTSASSAAHTALGALDVVVEITGLVDLENLSISGHTVTL